MQTAAGPEIDRLIDRRRALGLDTFDEIRKGTYYVAPAARFRHAYLDNAIAVLLDPYARAAGLIGSGPFNLGTQSDYRVPDRGFHRELLDAVYLPTAAIVVEILSPEDDSDNKMPFYAQHGVDEVWWVSPDQRIYIFELVGEYGYAGVLRSQLLNVDAATVTQSIVWP